MACGEDLASRIELECLMPISDEEFDQKFVKRDILFDRLFHEIVRGPSKLLALIGMGGAGKSTFARWVARELLKGLKFHGLLPVIADLKQPAYALPAVDVGAEPLEALRREEARQVALQQAGGLLEWVLACAEEFLWRHVRALEKAAAARPEELRERRASAWEKLKRIVARFLSGIERAAKVVDDGEELAQELLKLLGLAGELVALAAIPTPLGAIVALFLFVSSLRALIAGRGTRDLAFFEQKMAELLSRVAGRARRRVPGLRGFLIIVDDLNDIPKNRRNLLLALWYLATGVNSVLAPSGLELRVLVIARSTVTPVPGREREPEDPVDLLDPPLRRTMLWCGYRRLYLPPLSEDELKRVRELLDTWGYRLEEGEEDRIVRTLWRRCQGCPRVMCLALAARRHEKEEAGLPEEEVWTVRLKDVEEVPEGIDEVYRRWFRTCVVGKSGKPDLAEEVLKFASLMPLPFRREWMVEAVLRAKPGADEGDVEDMLDELVERRILALDEEGRYDFAPGHQALKAFVREDLLKPRDRARRHAGLVEALWALREDILARGEKLEAAMLEAVAYHAHAHLVEARRPEEEALFKGLEAARSLSAFYCRRGLPGPCARVARLGIQLARALDKPLEELILIERLARFALNVGLPLRRLEELVRRAGELVRRIEEEKPREADRARHRYCYIARFLAWRPGGGKGLELLERVERDYADRIADEGDMLDAKEALDDIRAKLLIELGRLDDAEAVIRRHLERVRMLREKGYLSERGYRQRMAVIENDLGELLFRRGRLEDLKEAIEHFRAFRQHCRAISYEGGVAGSLMNETMCLLALGGPERAREAVELLSEASRTFRRTGDWQGCCRSLRLMSLAHLVLGNDNMALERAAEALWIAHGELADMPFELADSWLIMAYACLVTRRVPSAGRLPEEAVRYLEGIGRPPSVPAWLHTSMVCAEIAEKSFEQAKDLNALIARLVRLVGSCLLGLLSFQELLDAFEEARDAFARAGDLHRARLLGGCLQALREQGGLGDADFLEEFLRRVFVRVLI